MADDSAKPTNNRYRLLWAELLRRIFNPTLTVTFCCGRKYLTIFKAFSRRPPHVTASSVASAFGPSSLNLLAIFAIATKKLLNSGSNLTSYPVPRAREE